MQKRVLFLFVCYRLCYEGQEEARAYEEEVLIPEREREEKKVSTFKKHSQQE